MGQLSSILPPDTPGRPRTRSVKLATWLLLGLLFAAWLAACAPAAAPAPAQVARTAAAEKPAVTEAPAATQSPGAAKDTVGATTHPPSQPTQVQPAAPAATEAPAATQPPAAALGTLAPAASESPAGSPAQGTPVASPPTATPAAATASSSGSPAQPSPLLPLPTLTSTPANAENAAPTPEAYLVHVDWPSRLRLGESDVVRLALVPVSQGYKVVVEYPEHTVVTQTVAVHQSPGYELFAVARLDGVAFDIAPQGDQLQYIPASTGSEPSAGQRLEWRWSLAARQSGRQRLMISLRLRWVPTQIGAAQREVSAYSQGLEVQAISFLGLTQSQAMLFGLFSAILGGGLFLAVLVIRPARRASGSQSALQSPNPALAIELPPGLRMAPAERSLLQAIFRRYARLVIEREFLSGYSGARAFLVLPVRNDGRSDAYTIAKLGQAASIQREFQNYETYVKDTLPPITARIQHPPASTSESRQRQLAALQYTFIGEPGKPPVSLRQALLDQPDPAFLEKLMETFGPNWWLQHRPFTFRLAAEYDRLLPTHLVIEPETGKAPAAEAFLLDGHLSPGEVNLQAGALVKIQHFPFSELRADGQSLSLQGAALPGQPPLRVRWMSERRPESALGRVAATRLDLLRGFSAGCRLPPGLPDPLPRLPALLEETISGSQSTIHGDLNLENILIGPGGMLWLIDFAQTRDGHTLFDFAHLRAELVAHVLATAVPTPEAYLALLQNPAGSPYAEYGALLTMVDSLAERCLLNPARPGEYRRAALLASLGALKYANLETHARCLLYLTAASLTSML